MKLVPLTVLALLAICRTMKYPGRRKPAQAPTFSSSEMNLMSLMEAVYESGDNSEEEDLPNVVNGADVAYGKGTVAESIDDEFVLIEDDGIQPVLKGGRVVGMAHPPPKLKETKVISMADKSMTGPGNRPTYGTSPRHGAAFPGSPGQQATFAGSGRRSVVWNDSTSSGGGGSSLRIIEDYQPENASSSGHGALSSHGSRSGSGLFSGSRNFMNSPQFFSSSSGANVSEVLGAHLLTGACSTRSCLASGRQMSWTCWPQVPFTLTSPGGCT